MMDGGIRSTTNVDIAVEKGAKFIVVVNPIVPFVNDFAKRVPTIFGSRVRRVSDMGFVAIANQAVRMIAHDRLHRAVEEWESRYPGVDILLIEPEFDDELMFGTSIMDYSARLQIAKHGFESVTLRLARDYDRYKTIAERHGIEISARRIKPRARPGRARARARLRPGAASSSRRPARCSASAAPDRRRFAGRPAGRGKSRSRRRRRR